MGGSGLTRCPLKPGKSKPKGARLSAMLGRRLGKCD